MIRVRQVKVPLEDKKNLRTYIEKKLKTNIIDFKIIKESLDARKKPELYFVYEVDVVLSNENDYLKFNKSNDILLAPDENFRFEITGDKFLNGHPIIIGAGPAGLFCGYILAQYGYKPLIVERGEKIEERIKSVEEFWNNGNLNINSNIVIITYSPANSSIRV